jgi:hypothetical protein
MKSVWSGRGRLLAFPLLISAAAVAGTLAFGSASSAASHPPAKSSMSAAPAMSAMSATSKSPLTAALSSALYGQGLEISKPAADTGQHISQQAAVAVARAQPMAPSQGVEQVALAHVTFYQMRPKVSGLFWVISLKPSGYVPSNGLPGKRHRPVKTRYYYIVVNAVTGHVDWASIGG